MIFAASVSAQPCAQVGALQVKGALTNSALTEISGLAASIRNPGLLWAHNDSGDSARIFAVSGTTGGLRATVILDNATAVDWEDIATGPPAAQQVYIADTGNNALDRATLHIYRIDEPSVTNTTGNVTIHISEADDFPFKYAGAELHDSETLLCDPANGDLYIVTRDRAGVGLARVFKYAAPLQAGVTVTLPQIATITGHTNELIKGGEFAPNGTIGLLEHGDATRSLLWLRDPETTVTAAFANTPCITTLTALPQAEALTFNLAGDGFYVTSEGIDQPLQFYPVVYAVSGMTGLVLD
ncbi:hypothetical protein BH09SUM1_BH09SUM1_33520 [soil metagenome]